MLLISSWLICRSIWVCPELWFSAWPWLATTGPFSSAFLSLNYFGLQIWFVHIHFITGWEGVKSKMAAAVNVQRRWQPVNKGCIFQRAEWGSQVLFRVFSSEAKLKRISLKARNISFALRLKTEREKLAAEIDFCFCCSYQCNWWCCHTAGWPAHSSHRCTPPCFWWQVESK